MAALLFVCLQAEANEEDMFDDDAFVERLTNCAVQYGKWRHLPSAQFFLQVKMVLAWLRATVIHMSLGQVHQNEQRG